MNIQNNKRERGVAMLLAMVSIMLLFTLSTDLILSSSLQARLALGAKDKIRAEYLAKSGLSLGIYGLTLSWAADLYRAQPEAPQWIKKPLSDSSSSLWNIFNEIPFLGAALVSQVEGFSLKDKEDDPFELKGVLGEEGREQMKLFEDSFSVKITDEQMKINLNACANGRCQETMDQLVALFSCPAEKSFLMDETNLTPLQLAYRIKDFINSASTASPETGFYDKNAPYEKLASPYKTKNLPFDTLGELFLIEGWTPNLHKLFSPYLTVYPVVDSSKKNPYFLNINSVSPPFLACLIPGVSSQSSCGENFLVHLKDSQERGDSFDDVTKIQGFLSSLSCKGEEKSIPSEWFHVKSSVFEIKIQAQTGEETKNFKAVVERLPPGKKLEGKYSSNNLRSYRMLYWLD